MSYGRRAPRVDRNHAEVIDALRQAGASVQSLVKVGDGCPDGCATSIHAQAQKLGSGTNSLKELYGAEPCQRTLACATLAPRKRSGFGAINGCLRAEWASTSKSTRELLC